MRPGDIVEVDVMPFSTPSYVSVLDPHTGLEHLASVIEVVGPDVVRARVLSEREEAEVADTPVHSG